MLLFCVVYRIFLQIAQNVVMKRNYSAVFAAIILLAIIIALVTGFTPQKTTLTFADSSEKIIYLTFDDGPSDRVTPKILDVLKEENVKATFFIVGKNAVLRKDILRRAVREGHTLGVHSYSHVYNEIYSSVQSLLEDIDRCNKVIQEIAGAPASVYRFPGGSFFLSEPLKQAVLDRGMKYIDWNASLNDAELQDPTPDSLFDTAVATAANRDKVVLLAHDTTDKTATAEAIKNVIRYFKQQGYKFEKF